MNHPSQSEVTCSLHDPRVRAVLDRLHAEAGVPPGCAAPAVADPRRIARGFCCRPVVLWLPGSNGPSADDAAHELFDRSPGSTAPNL